MTAGVTGLIPAAGASRRFGSSKLLADLAGEPLLQHTLRAVLESGVSRVVLVVAPAHGLGAVPLIGDERVALAVNPEPDRGMFSSIQTGLRHVTPGQAVLVLPADMPFVRRETVAAVVETHRRGGGAVVAAVGGRRGHPLLIPGDVWPRLLEQDAWTTLKAALSELRVPVQEIPVDDPGVVRDVDVRGDLPA
jgi:molybdenum cofactor cytidylyltransferase